MNEGAPQSENRPEKSWLEKRAREVMLLAALGIGGAFLRDSREAQRPVEEKPFDEAKLHNLFDLEWVAPSQDGSELVFLRQVHGLGSFKEMEGNVAVQGIIIASQKHNEQALLDIGAKEVFVEGITAKWEEWFTENSISREAFRDDLKAKNFKKASEWLVGSMDAFQKGIAERKVVDDRVKAITDLFHLYCLNDFFEAIAQNGETAPIDAESLKRLGIIRQTLNNDVRLVGDKKYQWGGAFVLWAKGIVRIRAAEDPGLLAAAGALSNKVAAIKKGGDFEARRHRCLS